MNEFFAPPEWRGIDLASDLHLDGSTPKTRAVFQRYLERTTADAVFLMGDVFEVWVGDDLLDEPGFESALAGALHRASQSRFLAFMPGNRDFLLGAHAQARMGLHALPDSTVLHAWGERTVLTHGDAWCLDDGDYQQFRSEVRAAPWQTAFLGQPLAARRAVGANMRAQSEARKQVLGPSAYGDIDLATAIQTLRKAGSLRLIHGHTHRPADEVLFDPTGTRDDSGAPGMTGPMHRYVLSDWDCDDRERRRAQILRLTPTGVSRLNVADDGSLSPV